MFSLAISHVWEAYVGGIIGGIIGGDSLGDIDLERVRPVLGKAAVQPNL